MMYPCEVEAAPWTPAHWHRYPHTVTRSASIYQSLFYTNHFIALFCVLFLRIQTCSMFVYGLVHHTSNKCTTPLTVVLYSSTDVIWHHLLSDLPLIILSFLASPLVVVYLPNVYCGLNGWWFLVPTWLSHPDITHSNMVASGYNQRGASSSNFNANMTTTFTIHEIITMRLHHKSWLDRERGYECIYS